MKKVLSAVVFSLLLGSSAYADSCSKAFTGVFTSNQAVALCSKLPTTLFLPANVSPAYPNANAETVAGAGTVQGDAASLGQVAWHRVTGANGTVGVKLPPTTGLIVGTLHYIQSTTAGVLKIWPQTGGNINGIGVNSSFSTITGPLTVVCRVTASFNWDCA